MAIIIIVCFPISRFAIYFIKIRNNACIIEVTIALLEHLHMISMHCLLYYSDNAILASFAQESIKKSNNAGKDNSIRHFICPTLYKY